MTSTTSRRILPALLATVALLLAAAAFFGGRLLPPGGVPQLFAQVLGRKEPPVRTTEELQERLKTLKPGTVLRLAPGDYQGVTVRAIKTDGVVIESEDPSRPARLYGLHVHGSTGFTFRYILFSRPVTEPPGQYLVSLGGGSKGITLDSVELRGDGDPAEDKMISALMIRGCDGVQVTNSRLSRFRYALSILNSDNVTITRNELHELRTDAIRGGGVKNLLVANNVIGNFQPAPKDHPDGVQLWSNHQKEPGRHIVIRDNLIARDQGGIIQGIFIRDTKRQMPFEDITVSGNLILGSMYNGISIDGVNGLVVRDNMVIPYPGMKSWIRLDKAQQAEMTDNHAMLVLILGKTDVKQKRTKHVGAIRGDVSGVIRKWLQGKPELRDNPGPFLRRLAGMPG